MYLQNNEVVMFAMVHNKFFVLEKYIKDLLRHLGTRILPTDAVFFI